MLSAGTKVNVLPATATVELDCRILPGQTAESAMREILAVTGPGVDLELVHTTSGAAFSIDTPLYRLLERATAKMDPGGIVMPLLSPGASDAAEYQRAGIKVYGFTPMVLPKSLPLFDLAHGHDERLPISGIESGLPVLREVIREFCTT